MPFLRQKAVNRLMATEAELKQWLTVEPKCKSSTHTVIEAVTIM